MYLHVLVRIHMIETQAGRAERLELCPDLDRELMPDPRQKEKPNPGARHVSVEFAVATDESRNLGA